MSDTSGQKDTLARATEQYREILRLDPTDTDAALWLARLYRLQNDHDKAEQVLRTLLTRDPDNESGVEQLTQLLLDEGKSPEAIRAQAQRWGSTTGVHAAEAFHCVRDVR